MLMKPLRHLVPLVLAGLLAVSCSSEQKTWLKVDVRLDTGVTAPTAVQVRVESAAAQELATQEVPWSKAVDGVLKVALPLSIDATTTVSVKATGLLQGVANSAASQDGVQVEKDKENGPVALVLKATSVIGTDGGSDAQVVPDAGAPETGSAQEAGIADVVTPSPDAGVDTPVVPDAAPADVAADVPTADVVNADAATDTAPSHAWSTPINVQKSDPTYTCPPEVAIAPVSGDAVVIWIEDGMGVFVANYKTATAKWSAPISLFAKGEPRSAAIAVDANGVFTAVWGQNFLKDDPTPLGIYASTSTDGATWSTPKRIAENGQTNPWYETIRIAMNRNGQARLVWEEQTNPVTSDSENRLYSMFLSATAPKVDLLDKCSSDCIPRIAIDGNGSGLVVWNNIDKGTTKEPSVWAARFSKDQVQANELVENYDVSNADTAEVAINAAGQGMVVWQQRTSSSNLDIYARRYSTSLGWTGDATQVAHVYWAGEMSLAMNSQGTANLGWSRPTAMLYQATFSSQPLSGTWTTANRETDDRAPDLTTTDVEPQVALDATGNVLMSWRKKTDNTTFAPHFSWQVDGTWTEAEVGKIADMFAFHVRTAVADNGQAVAAWSYFNCSPDSSSADKMCPGAKKFADLSAEAKAAWGNVFVSVYR